MNGCHTDSLVSGKAESHTGQHEYSAAAGVVGGLALGKRCEDRRPQATRRIKPKVHLPVHRRCLLLLTNRVDDDVGTVAARCSMALLMECTLHVITDRRDFGHY